MIELNDFAAQLADVYELDDPTILTPETKLRDVEGWSSFTALGIMAMVKSEYDIALTAQQMREAITIADLFNILKANFS